jgi:hypothetical protein
MLKIHLTTCAGLAVLLACGCHRGDQSALTPLPVEQIPPVIEKSFAKADEETKAAASRIAADTQSHDAPAAFTEIQNMWARPGLTLEQKIALNRAQHAVSQQLSDAAQNGDDRAAETLHHYLSTK